MAEQTPDNPLHALEATLNAVQSEYEVAKGELETAERNWRGLPWELNTLREEERQLGKEPDRNRASLDALKNTIADKEQKENETRTRLREAYRNLAEKKWAVTKKASALNRKAVSIILKTVKDVIIEACKNLPPFKTVGLSYGSFAVGGNGYQAAFSLSNDVNSFKGAGLSDILLPISLLPLAAILAVILMVSVVTALILAGLVCLPIPGYAERLAGFFQWAFRHTWLKAVLSIGFVIFSVLVGVGEISSSPPERIKDKVTIETVPPAELNGEYFRVNANSTYLFLQSLDPNDTSIKRVPVSQIAYITVNDGEREPGPASPVHALLERIEKEHEALRHGHAGYAVKDHKHKNNDPGDHTHDAYAAKNHNHKAVDPGGHKHAAYAVKNHDHNYAPADHKHKPNGPGASHEHANYITEDLLRTRINEEMACEGGEEARMSGFIRFNRGSANLDDFDANSKEIENFASKRGQATKWRVFGFASPDGEQRVNKGLSQKRAQAVEKVLCGQLGCSGTSGTKVEMKGFSEDHPINGIANSRSAIIAVCTKREASQGE